jgi:hemoglobin
MNEPSKTLYERLGGYDAISAVASELLGRLRADPHLGRFWAHRGEDGIMREKQLLINFLCQAAGGPMYYKGRDMKLSHRGMRISGADWEALKGHLKAVFDGFKVPPREQDDVFGFIESIRHEIVEID